MTAGQLRPLRVFGTPVLCFLWRVNWTFFAAAGTRTAASVCAHNATCGEAHSWWTASRTNRAVPWVAYRNGCDPSPPSSLPSLLRPGVLNVPCFLACTGPSHPHPSLLTTPPILCPPPSLMENWSRKGPNESVPASQMNRAGKCWTVFLGKPSTGRKPTTVSEEKNFSWLGYNFQVSWSCVCPTLKPLTASS